MKRRKKFQKAIGLKIEIGFLFCVRRNSEESLLIDPIGLVRL